MLGLIVKGAPESFRRSESLRYARPLAVLANMVLAVTSPTPTHSPLSQPSTLTLPLIFTLYP